MILDILNELEATPSRLEKEAILKREISNTELQEVFLAALNPFTQYYINKIPEYTECDLSIRYKSLSLAILSLKNLSERVYTGNKAINYLATTMSNLHSADAIVLSRIIKKDLRCGVQDATINKIWPNLIPSFDVMLASKYDENNIEFPVLMQPKIDGIRVLAFVSENGVSFKTRSGKEINTLQSIAEDLMALGNLSGYVLDGEIVSGSFQNTISDVKRKTAKADVRPNFYIFDCMPVSYFATQTNPDHQLQRENDLDFLCQSMQTVTQNIKVIKSVVVNSKEEVAIKYREMLEAGFEGAILKNPEGLYEFKRSKNWIKVKPAETVDLEITGFEEGTGKYKGMLGSFVVDLNGVDCSVGGGFSDEQRSEFWKNRIEMLGTLIEIEYMELTLDKRMRHPRFLKCRSYKGSKV